MAEGRGGFVLVLVLVALLSLALLLQGGLVLARSEHAVARAGEGLLQARAQAGLAFARFAGHLLPDSARAAHVLSGAGPGGRHELRARRLDREGWLLEAEGWDPDGTALHRLILPAWRLAPGARVLAQRAVVAVAPGAPVEGASRIAGLDLLHDGDPPAPGCRSLDALLDSLSRGPVAAAAPWSGDGPPALGMLDLEELRARIPVEVLGRGRPTSAVQYGRCSGGAWSWGDPREDAGPCRERWVARSSPGDLEVAGGSGQGLWVTAGDLVVGEGARLRGMAVVGGRLVVKEGARFEGLVRAAGGVAVDRASVVVGSACLASLALESADTLLGPAILSGGGPWWVPGGGP